MLVGPAEIAPAASRAGAPLSSVPGRGGERLGRGGRTTSRPLPASRGAVVAPPVRAGRAGPATARGPSGPPHRARWGTGGTGPGRRHRGRRRRARGVRRPPGPTGDRRG